MTPIAAASAMAARHWLAPGLNPEMLRRQTRVMSQIATRPRPGSEASWGSSETARGPLTGARRPLAPLCARATPL